MIEVSDGSSPLVAHIQNSATWLTDIEFSDFSSITLWASSSLTDIHHQVRIPADFVHPFRSIPYTDSGVFVHPVGRPRSAGVS